MEPIQKILKPSPFESFLKNKKDLRLAYINSNPVLTQEESNKYNKIKEKRLNKAIILSASIAAGLGVLGLGAGIPRFRSSITKGINYLERTSKKLTQKENKLLTTKYLNLGISKLIIVFKFIKAIGNFVPIRDIEAGKILNKTVLGKRFAESTTKYFEKKTIEVTESKLNTVKNAFKIFEKENSDILLYLENNPQRDKIINHPKTGEKIKTSEYIKERMTILENEINNYTDGFNNTRLHILKNKTSSAKKEAQEKIRNRELHINIADETLKEDKKNLSDVLHAIKNSISNDTNHKVAEINKELKEINSWLRKGSNKERRILLDIKDLCTCYESPSKYIEKHPKRYPNLTLSLNSQEKEMIRAQIQKDVINKTKNLKTKISNSGQYIEEIAAAMEKLSELNNKMQEKGLIEEISQYSKIFKPEESYKYNHFKQARRNLKRQIRRAIYNEENKLFDKMRDLNIGAAPTDILGQLLPIAAVTYNISTSKNKKGKISSTLKGGIPVLGGIGTILFATLRQVNSFGSVILGLGVGIVLNKIGAKVVKAIYPPIIENQELPKT